MGDLYYIISRLTIKLKQSIQCCNGVMTEKQISGGEKKTRNRLTLKWFIRFSPKVPMGKVLNLEQLGICKDRK